MEFINLPDECHHFGGLIRLPSKKTLPHRIFSAWYGPWVKPKLRSSLHCTSTESGQNTVIHRISSHLTYPQVIFCPDFLVNISTKFSSIQMLELKIIGQNIFCSRKGNQEGQGRQAQEQIRNVSSMSVILLMEEILPVDK